MKSSLFAALSLGLLIGFQSHAQRTPSPSPAASLTQTVGITDFQVNYSRPGLKGRAAFGTTADAQTVRPYGQVWRTGANAATTVKLSTDASFEGQNLPAGTYSLFSIPAASGNWTVIFNKDVNATEQSYKPEDDALRVNVAPQNHGKLESFTIWFSDLTDSTAHFNFGWDQTMVATKVAVKTSALVEAGVAKSLAEKPEDPAVNQRAANYYLSQGKDLQKGLTLIDKALAAGENYQKLWTKAQLLMKLSNFKEALPVAQKALALGNANPDNAFNVFFKGQIENGLKDIQAKLPSVDEMKKKVSGKKKKA
ncbi:DUF2911 domain-containing protein [Siphonobacter curvatus]|uniref:DUF2911 domain-containing protein n=1 Tax=Siphonobacter curvatus TaxID=2094562 RepID=A0A2S7ILR9_9BACT|nr:DUF2911 domain-containing protein [Siphonobacter curvatus]PQA58693.1 hypothetical protein C5O19_03240 [Siphonobacter curvatus]